MEKFGVRARSTTIVSQLSIPEIELRWNVELRSVLVVASHHAAGGVEDFVPRERGAHQGELHLPARGIKREGLSRARIHVRQALLSVIGERMSSVRRHIARCIITPSGAVHVIAARIIAQRGTPGAVAAPAGWIPVTVVVIIC